MMKGGIFFVMIVLTWSHTKGTISNKGARHETGFDCCPRVGRCTQLLAPSPDQQYTIVNRSSMMETNETGFLQKHLLVTKNTVFRGSVQTYRRTAWDWSEKLSMQQLGLPTESQTPVSQWLENVLLTSRIPLGLKKFMVPRKFIVVDLPKCCFCLHDKRSVQKKL